LTIIDRDALACRPHRNGSNREAAANQQRSAEKPGVSPPSYAAPADWGVITLASKFDQVFVMRFWQENDSADPADPNRWRTRINHVNSRQKFHVVGLERAFLLVKTMLGDENGLSLGKYPERKNS
jgi:hypothetical protein